jgi:hypothetical protein
MNILFLTMAKFTSVENRGIYTDLMRKLRDSGHGVYIVFPSERRSKLKTYYLEKEGVQIIGVRTLNVQKTNIIEKGIGQVSIELLYKRAVKKYFKDISFDLILYSTPPITFPNVISYCKKVNPQAISYLLLKDIFPQNAVDIGMMKKSGIKGLLYKYFRRKEKKSYKLSDYIGCMSPANVHYLITNNPEINPNKVEIAPNSIELNDEIINCDKIAIRTKYGLPINKPIFIYGGNLGKPQGISFIIECLNANKSRKDCHFVIVGNGTEYDKLDAWMKNAMPANVSLYARLPKEDYDMLVKSCDVGLIFLDYRFTIPNYPSRLLSYLENKMPIIACTDKNCDTGLIAEKFGYGLYCPSNDISKFTLCINEILSMDVSSMGEKGYKFLKDNYLVEHTYNVIIKHFNV